MEIRNLTPTVSKFHSASSPLVGCPNCGVVPTTRIYEFEINAGTILGWKEAWGWITKCPNCDNRSDITWDARSSAVSSQDNWNKLYRDYKVKNSDGYLPCPFCGSIKIREWKDSDNLYELECVNCSCTVHGKNADERKTLWNTRQGVCY